MISRQVRFCLTIAAVFHGACSHCGGRPACDSSSEVYHIGHGDPSLYIEMDWSVAGSPPLSQLSEIVVAISPRADVSRNFVEFYFDDPFGGTARVDVVPSSYDDLRWPSVGGCRQRGVAYALRSLPGGEYLVVHRRSSVPPGYVSNWVAAGGSWETFEGEDALVRTISLSGAGRPPDAGP